MDVMFTAFSDIVHYRGKVCGFDGSLQGDDLAKEVCTIHWDNGETVQGVL